MSARKKAARTPPPPADTSTESKSNTSSEVTVHALPPPLAELSPRVRKAAADARDLVRYLGADALALERVADPDASEALCARVERTLAVWHDVAGRDAQKLQRLALVANLDTAARAVKRQEWTEDFAVEVVIGRRFPGPVSEKREEGERLCREALRAWLTRSRRGQPGKWERIRELVRAIQGADHGLESLRVEYEKHRATIETNIRRVLAAGAAFYPGGGEP